MCVIHCELQEFIELLIRKHLKAFVRPYVLNAHIAGIVYMAKDAHGNLYYYDRLYVTDQKKQEFDQLPSFDVHSELYRKISLDEYVRNQMAD